MSDAPHVDPLVFAAAALQEGLVAPDALAKAVVACAEDGRLAEQLVADGALSPERAQRLATALARVASLPVDDAAHIPLEHPGRYQVQGPTGRGGQAQVLVALDRFMGREVAVKVHSPWPGADSPGADRAESTNVSPARRFLREARITAQLEHPNIVTVHEVGRRADGSLYYAMRLVRGRTLAEELAACRTLSDRLRLLKPFLDACNAVGFAHSRGVVHRDVKPANIMVGEFGETVVLDWGIARVPGGGDTAAGDIRRRLRLLEHAGEGDSDDARAGTPAYMSPEQAVGAMDEIDARSDVWALGVVLYEILSGKRPFRGATDRETLVLITTTDPEPVRRVQPGVPRDLAAVVAKAMSRRQEERYRSASELAREISAFMTGGRVGAYGYTAWELLHRFGARNRVAAGAAAAALAAVVTALVMTTAALREESRARAREREEGLVAGMRYAQACDEKASRLAADGRHQEALLLAAASLGSNPAHPRSALHDEGFSAAHPESRELRLRSVSTLFRAQFESQVTLRSRLVAGNALRGVAFSPDGTRVAAGVEGGTVLVWDPVSGARSELRGPVGRPHSAAFSPDGRRVAAAGRGMRVLVWEAGGGPPVLTIEGHSDVVASVRFSPDGRTIASGSWDGTARLWEAATGAPVRVLEPHGGRVNSVAFSPDGRLLATAAGDGVVRVWDIAAGGVLRQWSGESDTAQSVDFSRDGSLVAWGGIDKVLRVREVATGRTFLDLRGHDNGILSVAFSPDGRTLASAGYDRTVRLWDAATGLALATIGGHDDLVYAVAFSPDGQSLVSACYDRVLRLWRSAPGRRTATMVGHGGNVYALAASPDGRVLASGGWDRTVRLWSAEDGRLLHVLAGHTDVVDAVVFSPDGSRLASVARDRMLRVWDPGSGAVLSETPSEAGVVGDVDISPAGDMLAVSGSDGVVKLRRFPSLEPAGEIRAHSGSIGQIAFSRDGRLLASAGVDRLVRVWEVPSGAPVAKLEGHRDWAWGLAFSPDGKLLASSGKDGLAVIWDAATWLERTELRGHRGWINTVRFSPDGRLVATGSDDQTVRVWDAAAGEAMLALGARAEVAALAFSPDGRTLAMADGSLVRTYPLDFSLRDVDPAALRAQAGPAAGVVLDGLDVRSLEPGHPETREPAQAGPRAQAR